MGFQEPINNEDDIVKFCEETDLAVALDETINCIKENPLQVLQKYNHSGVAAVVSSIICLPVPEIDLQSFELF